MIALALIFCLPLLLSFSLILGGYLILIILWLLMIPLSCVLLRIFMPLIIPVTMFLWLRPSLGIPKAVFFAILSTYPLFKFFNALLHLIC